MCDWNLVYQNSYYLDSWRVFARIRKAKYIKMIKLYDSKPDRFMQTNKCTYHVTDQNIIIKHMHINSLQVKYWVILFPYVIGIHLCCLWSRKRNYRISNSSRSITFINKHNNNYNVFLSHWPRAASAMVADKGRGSHDGLARRNVCQKYSPIIMRTLHFLCKSTFTLSNGVC